MNASKYTDASHELDEQVADLLDRTSKLGGRNIPVPSRFKQEAASFLERMKREGEGSDANAVRVRDLLISYGTALEQLKKGEWPEA